MDDSFALAGSQQVTPTASEQPSVLVVTPVGLEGKGGIDRLNLYLHSYLDQRGLAVHLRLIGSRGEKPAPFWTLTFAAALARFSLACARGTCDLVHIHVSTDGSALRKVAFGMIARLLGRPYVIQYHGMMSAEIEARRPAWYRALSSLARGADRVIVLGDAYRGPFERMGVESAKLEVVYNGVPDIGAHAHIPRPTGPITKILFSGEVGERKGTHLLVEALGQLQRNRTDWRCVIAGNGEIESLRARAVALGIEDKLSFTGWIGIDNVHAHMRDADIVVLPSRAEALPLALIEGASAGAALVACDVGAVAEVVVNGVNGMIVSRDAQSVSTAIEKLIANPSLRTAMQDASRRIYRERFEASRFARSILQCYQQVLESRRKN